MFARKLPISLVMIAKNEQKHLPACLDSVRELVSEMIVLDTGSQDNTIAIAREKGALVYHYTWKNDFSDARNAALSYATYPWILQLDADEELFQEDIPWFYNTYPWHRQNGYWMYIHNYKENQQVMHAHPLIRFFKNHPEHQYKYRIHENLMLRGGTATVSEARIFHKGYANQELDQQKAARNFALIQERLREEPDDPLSHYYFAQHYAGQRDFSKASAPARKALTMGLGMPTKVMAIRIALIGALLENRADKFQEALAYAPNQSEFPDRLLYEYYLLKSTQPQQALSKLNTYFQLVEQEIKTGQFGKIERSTPENYAQALTEYAQLLEQQKEYMLALVHIEKALAFTAKNFELLAQKARLLLLAGKKSEALKTTDSVIQQLEALPNQPEGLVEKYLAFKEKLSEVAF